MTTRDFCKQIERLGFVLKRRNGHLIYSDGFTRLVVPCHKGDIDRRLSKQLKIDLRKALEARLG